MNFPDIINDIFKDEDSLLIAALVIILIHEQADSGLVFVLLYVLLF